MVSFLLEGGFPRTCSLTLRQLKYFIVIVDYFMKWIEVKTLAKINTINVMLFFKKNILTNFCVANLIQREGCPLNKEEV